MQTRNYEGNVNFGDIFNTLKDAQRAAEERLKRTDTAEAVIGLFPKMGEVLIVNNMECKVIKINRKKRSFTLKMVTRLKE